MSKSIGGLDDLTGWITVPTKLLLLEDSRMTCTSRWRSRDSVKYLASSANGSVAFGSGLFSLSNLNAGLCREQIWMNTAIKWIITLYLHECQISSVWCGETREARKVEAWIHHAHVPRWLESACHATCWQIAVDFQWSIWHHEHVLTVQMKPIFLCQQF